MPLLVAQRNTHQGVAVLDRCHRATSNKLLLEHQQPLDFTMSKYKPTSRHQLYRQIYSAEDSLQYDHKSHQDQGKTLFHFIRILFISFYGSTFFGRFSFFPHDVVFFRFLAPHSIVIGPLFTRDKIHISNIVLKSKSLQTFKLMAY